MNALQDPVMFTGSLLDNLDPFRERSERDVWKALETVSAQHLGPFFRARRRR